MGGGGGVQSHFHVKPNSVEVVLRLSWGCDNINETELINCCFLTLSLTGIARPWLLRGGADSAPCSN